MTVCSVCAYEYINNSNLKEWRLKHFEDLQSNLILKRPLTFLRKATDGERLNCTPAVLKLYKSGYRKEEKIYFELNIPRL